MADQGNGPELKVQYSVDGIEDVKKANEVVIDGAKKVDNQVKQSGSTFEKYRDILGKVAAFAGGSFVTAALAAGRAIYNANEQVSALDKSMRVSSGTMQNYERNQRALQEVADKYHKSIFLIAEGYNTLSRETRGTINEGVRTQQMFDDLTVSSGKIGYSVTDTTDRLGSFIDKMKQGTVDSTGLSDELDKRLYEAFVKVAQGMNLTAAELNAVMKESDEAVATVLPKLTAELKNALGEVPQQDAKNLGDRIEYAQSKLTLLLDGLFDTSGGKTALAQAADDAGGLLDILNKINRDHGIMAAGGAAISMAAVKASSGLFGVDYELDPFGYKGQIDTENQRKVLNKASSYSNGMPIGWAASKGSNAKLPSEYAQTEFDIVAAAAQNRADAEEKANQKLIAAAKRAASERKRALDEITRQEIQESNERIREGLLAAEAAVRQHYADRPSSNISGQLMTGTGTVRKFNDSSFTKSHEEFSNPVSMGGDLNYDHIVAQINLMNDAWGQNFVKVSASTRATNDLAIATQNLNQHLSETMKQIAVNGSVDMFSDFADGIGQVAAKTSSIDDVARRIGMAFGSMIAQTGKAVLEYGILMTGIGDSLKASFSNPGVAIAVGLAAIAAGSYLKASASKNQQQAVARMWDGGIADSIGTDRIPTMLSYGEMVFPMREQQQLYGLIKQTNTGSLNSPAVGVGGPSGDMTLSLEFESQLRSGDIYLSNKYGQKKVNYFK